MKRKRSFLLLIALLIGIVYLCLQANNYSKGVNVVSSVETNTAEGAGTALGTAIGMTLLLPHIILVTLAVIFNAVGWLGKARWAALTAAILYSVGGVLGLVNFVFVLVPMILCFVAYGKMKNRPETGN